MKWIDERGGSYLCRDWDAFQELAHFHHHCSSKYSKKVISDPIKAQQYSNNEKGLNLMRPAASEAHTSTAQLLRSVPSNAPRVPVFEGSAEDRGVVNHHWWCFDSFYDKLARLKNPEPRGLYYFQKLSFFYKYWYLRLEFFKNPCKEVFFLHKKGVVFFFYK